MQRVIRTEFYFEGASSFPATEDGFPSLSVAWIRRANSGLDPERLAHFAASPDLNLRLDQSAGMEAALSILLLNPTALPHGQLVIPAEPPDEARELRLQPIVIERSPPVSEPLFGLLHKATFASIGTFMGLAITPGEAPLLMLVTVPLGCIIMGSAMGVSRGLSVGLAKRVEAALLSPTTTAPNEAKEPKRSAAKKSKRVAKSAKGTKRSGAKKSARKGSKRTA
jgi:hypothetical protein